MSINLWNLAIILMAALGLYSVCKWAVKNPNPNKVPIRKQNESVNQTDPLNDLKTKSDLDRH